MTEEMAILFAKSKMRELGVGRKYLVRYRHFRLAPNEQVKIKGENHLFLLLQPETTLKVESKAGIFDMQDSTINELQYAHRGIIVLTNSTQTIVNAKFLQVIPLIKKENL
jgi:hypothetical protein